MRRVVAGTNEAGRSLVISEASVGTDGGPVIFRVGGGLPSVQLATIPDEVTSSDAVIVHLWESPGGAAADVATDLSAGATAFTMEPAPEGLTWRYHIWGPGRTSKAHATSTLDLLFVISGEVALVLDEGDVTLRAGDALVLQAASHGWRAGDEGCTFVSSMRRLM
ncbi:cupin domain-containing protein [Modestobacter excelsi]|uniref:cupin domain-containing protein n=1 Tax=Modestobacter excelsi TaxID=2213161 RepID=UPI00110CCE0C|nr:cupin domain-containing protein [Modestobacter excelsi]